MPSYIYIVAQPFISSYNAPKGPHLHHQSLSVSLPRVPISLPVSLYLNMILLWSFLFLNSSFSTSKFMKGCGNSTLEGNISAYVCSNTSKLSLCLSLSYFLPQIQVKRGKEIVSLFLHHMPSLSSSATLVTPITPL